MRKYAEVFEFDESEADELLQYWLNSEFDFFEDRHGIIFFQRGITVGEAKYYSDGDSNGVRLYVFEGIENNPFYRVLERYAALKNSTASSKSEAAQVPWPHA